MKFTLKDFDKPKSYSICDTCTSAQVFRESSGKTRVYCNKLGSYLPRPVEACNKYSKIGELDLFELKQLAWLIDLDPRRKAGFAWLKPGKDSGKRKDLMRDVEPDSYEWVEE